MCMMKYYVLHRDVVYTDEELLCENAIYYFELVILIWTSVYLLCICGFYFVFGYSPGFILYVAGPCLRGQRLIVTGEAGSGSAAGISDFHQMNVGLVPKPKA